jgi:hypothetical protein
MKLVAAFVIGLLIGCLVVSGLVAFKNAAWAKAKQWSQENPPPVLTPARRAFLKTGNFIAQYWLLSSPLIVLLFGGTGVLIAARRTRQPT